MRSLSELLRKLLADKKVRQAAVANELGVNPSYVNHLVSGHRRTTTAAHATKMAKMLGVPVETFDAFISDASVSTANAVGRYEMLGTVGAGPGVDAPPEPQTVNLPQLCRGADGVYQVSGTSMVGAGVLNGDYLVVRLNPEPDAGELAVAWIEDAGAVVKRVKRIDGRVVLLSEGPNEKRHHHVMTERDRFLGTLVAVFRSYQVVPPPPAKKPKKKP